MAHQDGHIRKDKARRCWFGMWREDVLQPDGTIVRKQRSRKLADISSRYRYKSDVKPLLDEILAPLNDGKTDVRGTMTVEKFVQTEWMPHCERELSPASVEHYQKGWRLIAPYIGKTPLRDLRAADVTDMLSTMRTQGKGHRTIKIAKTTGSVIFTRAIGLSLIDGTNPFKAAILPKRREKKQAKPMTTLQDIRRMLQVVTDVKARAAIGLTFFCGLVPSEARGALWQDYDGATLKITQSVYKTHTGPTKTAAREAPVPVIAPLRAILEELRIADGSPTSGPILRGPKGKPLNVDNLSRRVIRPALVAAGIAWHGFRPNRTGISTIATALAKDKGLAAKGLLRHSTLATTDQNYIQTVPAETLAAMTELERQYEQCCAVVVQDGVKATINWACSSAVRAGDS